jgi:hypothetical protein
LKQSIQMATAINLRSKKKLQSILKAEIKKRFDVPGRKPDEALDGMYGLWEDNNITIEKIREKKRRRKW